MQKNIKILKILGIFVASVLDVIVLYVFFSILFSIIPINRNIENDKDVIIYVRTNGIHADVVLPVQYDSINWSKKLPYSNTVGNDSMMKYVAFGWGDKEFYLNTPNWSDLKVSTAFYAIFGLGESVMHVTYYKSILESSNSFRIEISKQQYYLLAQYIHESFDTTANGNYINIKTDMVYGRNDAFYEGTGTYSLFNTCNTWINCGLKACQQKACFWTPFDKGIFYIYRNKLN